MYCTHIELLYYIRCARIMYIMHVHINLPHPPRLDQHLCVISYVCALVCAVPVRSHITDAHGHPISLAPVASLIHFRFQYLLAHRQCFHLSRWPPPKSPTFHHTLHKLLGCAVQCTPFCFAGERSRAHTRPLMYIYEHFPIFIRLSTTHICKPTPIYGCDGQRRRQSIYQNPP